ncbi:MAG: hypothetical protein NZU63_09710 [Gemmataceae bacterium]|nr:hypothetical protein [Gemmataceae bacterium]MDW8243699.1 hypothetical protein [Thermogemmata sp.]
MEGAKSLLQNWSTWRSQPLLERWTPLPAVQHTAATLLAEMGQSKVLDEVDRAVERFRRLRDVALTPIVGVLGEVNAGKSSVVAAFLSAAGRQRIPRGLEERFGTHRFVYWCPQAWQTTPEREQAFTHLLAQAHGHAPEPLAPDPDTTARQYHSGRDQPQLLPVPLLAWDSGLAHFALLDCPDIQTEDPTPSHTTIAHKKSNQRLDFVAQAAQICSAFFFVWERSKIRDRLATQFLERVREVMSNVPIYLLVNKVRPHPEALMGILRDVDIQRICEKFHIAAIYVAMDYDIPQWECYTPRGLREEAAATGPLPLFFRLDATTASQPQEAPPSTWLSRLFQQLPPAELQRKMLDSQADFLCRQLHCLVATIDSWIDQCQRTTSDAYRGLLQFCVDVFKDGRGEPLQIYDPVFNEKLNKVILDYAPWYVRLANWFNDHIKKGIEHVRGFFPLLAWKDNLSSWKDQLKHLGEGFADATDLARRSIQQRWIPSEWPEQYLVDTWKTVLDHFQQYRYVVQEEDLRPMAEDFWRHAPSGVGWRSALTILGSTAAVAGLVTAAVDGGATLLAGYSLVGALAAATPAWGALTVSLIGTSAALAVFYAGLVQHNSLPHLAAFFTLACDAFGLPRHLQQVPRVATFGRGEQARTLPLPDIDLPPLSPLHPLPRIGLWRWTDIGRQFRQAVIDISADRLASAASSADTSRPLDATACSYKA